MSLNLSVSAHGDAIVLTVDGRLELEGGSSAKFRDLVEQELRKGHKKIVVDLSNTTYADSSGIGELTSAYMRSANLGGNVVVANPVPKLREVLKITKLDTVLTPYDSVESALTAVQGNVS